MREEMDKNKELQKNQSELKKRMQELNDSEALKDARKKFVSISQIAISFFSCFQFRFIQEIVEQERLKSSEVVKKKVEELGEQMKKVRYR